MTFLVSVTLSGLGFGLCFAVDLALVADPLPNPDDAAKELGVFNNAGAQPFSLAPAVTPSILAVGGGSYGFPYAVASGCAAGGAFAV